MPEREVEGTACPAHRRMVCLPPHSQYPGPAVIQAEHGWSSAGLRTLHRSEELEQPPLSRTFAALQQTGLYGVSICA